MTLQPHIMRSKQLCSKGNDGGRLHARRRAPCCFESFHSLSGQSVQHRQRPMDNQDLLTLWNQSWKARGLRLCACSGSNGRHGRVRNGDLRDGSEVTLRYSFCKRHWVRSLLRGCPCMYHQPSSPVLEDEALHKHLLRSDVQGHRRQDGCEPSASTWDGGSRRHSAGTSRSMRKRGWPASRTMWPKRANSKGSQHTPPCYGSLHGGKARQSEHTSGWRIEHGQRLGPGGEVTRLGARHFAWALERRVGDLPCRKEVHISLGLSTSMRSKVCLCRGKVACGQQPGNTARVVGAGTSIWHCQHNSNATGQTD